MKRPKKNKIHNPTLPEDQQDLVDERNLVGADESEEISFEERLNIYWMENKGFISGCIALIALAIIGFNGMRIFKDYSQAQVQEAYAEAVESDTLADFAQAHSDKKIGGVAALAVADQAYGAEEFEKALNFYSIAVTATTGSILEGRAALGEAFARYQTGEKEAALTQLAAIASNVNFSQSARTEAAYHLAIEADVAGRTDDYERYVSQIKESPLSAQWRQRINMYERQAR